MNKKTNHLIDILKKEESEDNALEFWKELEGPMGNELANQLVQMIYNQFLYPDKKVNQHYDEEKMLSTLLIIEYFKMPKLKDLHLIQEYKKLLQTKKKLANLSNYQKWFLNLYIERHLTNKVTQFSKSLISRIMLVPIDIKDDADPALEIQNQIKDSQKYLNQVEQNSSEKQQIPLKYMAFPENSGVLTRSLCYGYVIYLDLIKKQANVVSEQLYGHMKKMLSKHLNALTFREGKSLPYLFSLIHFITQNITFFGCPYEEIIKEMLIIAAQIRNYPEILGEVGNQFFTLLHNQLKFPGTAFRKKLRNDFPTLDIKESKFINKPFYFIINSEEKSQDIAEEEKKISSIQHCSLLNLRKLMIWQVLVTSGFNEQQLKYYYKIVRSLDDQTTYLVYFKTLKITELTSSLEVYEKIKKMQKESMFELLKHLEEMEKNKQANHATLSEKQEFDYLCEKHPLGLFSYPNYEIIPISSREFQSKAKLEYSFIEIVKQNKLQFPSLNFYQNKIPIIFYGNGGDFSKIIETIVDYIENTDIERSKLLKVYYITSAHLKGKIGIGMYLASKDIWYRRFVFSINREKMIYPSYKCSEKNKNLLPTELFQKTISMYLREAKVTFPLRVFRCELKFKDDKPQSFYMASYLMMGLFAQAELMKSMKMKQKDKYKKYENIEPYEIITEKFSKLSPMTLSISYRKMINGEDKFQREEKVKVDDLQICNIPKTYFMGNIPDPTSNELEMSILTENFGKIFKKELANKQNFRRYNESEIKQAFKQLFANTSINSVTIDNLNRDSHGITVCIDGIFYHCVEKIHISSLYSKNNLPISIPIQTFLQFR